MSEIRSWNRYQIALEAFLARPTIRNEAAAIASYSEFARQFCPEAADSLITLFCGNLAARV